MDGTIVKNHEYHLQAWMRFWKNRGIQVTRQQMLQQFGRKNREILEAIIGHSISEEEAEWLAAEKEAFYRELYRPFIQPVDGLVSFLNKLRALGMKLGLATSAPTVNVNFVLDALRIRPFFDCIVDATMVERGKPHPDIFLKAAACVGVTPQKCLVFEDANAGIEAAQKAGCRVVALLTTHERFDLRDADLYIKDFTQWPLVAQKFKLNGSNEGL